MYHGVEPAADKKRPRKQPPNQVWLDAIMSKSRSAEPSPVNSVPTPSSKPMRMMRTTPTTDDAGDAMRAMTWQQQPSPSHHQPPLHLRGYSPHYVNAPPTLPPPSSTRSSRTPSPLVSPPHSIAPPTMSSDGEIDPTALASAMAKALKDLVAEQECCFIARGICHLCGGTDRNLVPVINFCPAFSPTHSLCREHLRSMHRVRLEDIFAGKNQPTVSKKSLRCNVCALACPCSKCQSERDNEFAKFQQWLVATQHDSSRRAAPQETVVPHPPSPALIEPLATASTTYEESPMNRRRGDIAETAPKAEEKARAYVDYEEEKPTSAYANDNSYSYDHDDQDSFPPLADAEPKQPSRLPRVPKRAAKESVPYPLDTSLGGLAPRRHTPRDESERSEGDIAAASPSAGSVLNCPDSERSLVDLLSSLNQRVTPAVRYFADSDEHRARTGGEQVTIDQATIDDVPSSSDKRAERFDQADGSSRRQKRKREVLKPIADTADRGASSDESAPPARTRSQPEKPAEDTTNSSYRRKAPTPLNTNEKKSKPAEVAPPTPSPRILSSTRIKFPAPTPVPPEPKPTPRKREAAPAPSPPYASRKRKADAAPPAAAERKSPRGRGKSKKSARQSVEHKTKKKKSRRAAESDDEVIKYTADEDEEEDEEMASVEGDGDDDSELDTNLDYCEVCLAAGDLVCCDVCPRSFHLSCLKMTEDDLPEGDWQCAECRKPSYFEAFAATVSGKTTVQSKCLQIVKCLKSHPFAKPFLLPVEDIPHYSNIVKQPMDLSTVEKKLNDGKYVVKGGHIHLSSFADDVRRVWANCKLFNDDGSGITRAADHLSEGFEKLYDSVVQFSERPATSSKSNPSTSKADGLPKNEENSASAAKPEEKASRAQATSTTKAADKPASVKVADKPSVSKPVAVTVSDKPSDSVSADKTAGTGDGKSVPDLNPSASPVKPASPKSSSTAKPASSAQPARSVSPSPVTSTANSSSSSANTSPTELTSGKSLDSVTTPTPSAKVDSTTESTASSVDGVAETTSA